MRACPYLIPIHYGHLEDSNDSLLAAVVSSNVLVGHSTDTLQYNYTFTVKYEKFSDAPESSEKDLDKIFI